MKLLDERRETVKELFKKLGTDYEDTDAELVLQVLKRQVVDDSGGRLVPQQRWINIRLARAPLAHRAERMPIATRSSTPSSASRAPTC